MIFFVRNKQTRKLASKNRKISSLAKKTVYRISVSGRKAIFDKVGEYFPSINIIEFMIQIFKCQNPLGILANLKSTNCQCYKFQDRTYEKVWLKLYKVENKKVDASKYEQVWKSLIKLTFSVTILERVCEKKISTSDKNLAFFR